MGNDAGSPIMASVWTDSAPFAANPSLNVLRRRCRPPCAAFFRETADVVRLLSLRGFRIWPLIGLERIRLGQICVGSCGSRRPPPPCVASDGSLADVVRLLSMQGVRIWPPFCLEMGRSRRISDQSFLGDLKRVLARETGLEPKEQRLLFQGKEKDDEECLHMVGAKDMSKVVLLEDPASKERKLVEINRNQTVLKACEEIAKVRSEVDKLNEKVIAVEAIVRAGTKVAENEFLVLTELLIVQLLQLDTVEADGEAKARGELRFVESKV